MYSPNCLCHVALAMAPVGACLVLSLGLQFHELPNTLPMNSFSVYICDHCFLLLAAKNLADRTKEKMSTYNHRLSLL